MQQKLSVRVYLERWPRCGGVYKSGSDKCHDYCSKICLSMDFGTIYVPRLKRESFVLICDTLLSVQFCQFPKAITVIFQLSPLETDFDTFTVMPLETELLNSKRMLGKVILVQKRIFANLTRNLKIKIAQKHETQTFAFLFGIKANTAKFQANKQSHSHCVFDVILAKRRRSPMRVHTRSVTLTTTAAAAYCFLSQQLHFDRH